MKEKNVILRKYLLSYLNMIINIKEVLREIIGTMTNETSFSDKADTYSPTNNFKISLLDLVKESAKIEK